MQVQRREEDRSPHEFHPEGFRSLSVRTEVVTFCGVQAVGDDAADHIERDDDGKNILCPAPRRVRSQQSAVIPTAPTRPTMFARPFSARIAPVPKIGSGLPGGTAQLTA